MSSAGPSHRETSNASPDGAQAAGCRAHWAATAGIASANGAALLGRSLQSGVTVHSLPASSALTLPAS